MNKNLNEDKLLSKYENEITEEDNNIKNSENYKKIIKYLRKNNLNDKIIKDNNRIIIDHLKNNEEKNIAKKYEMLMKRILWKKKERGLI